MYTSVAASSSSSGRQSTAARPPINECSSISDHLCLYYDRAIEYLHTRDVASCLSFESMVTFHLYQVIYLDEVLHLFRKQRS